MTIRRLLNYWIGKKRSGFYVFLGFCAASVYFAGIILDSPERQALCLRLRGAGFILFVAFVAALFIHLNLHAAHWFLNHFEGTDHLPKKQIALVNSFCMTVFLTVTVIALPAAAWGLEPLWQAIARWFSSRTSLDKAVYPALYMEQEPPKSPDLSALLGEPTPTAPWMAALDQLLRAAASVFLVLLILLAVRRLLSALWAWITKPRQFDDDEKIYLTPAWSLSQQEKRAAPRQPTVKARSYNEKIRRKYRRQILFRSVRHKRPLSSAATPEELEHAVGLDNPPLHQLYEKARYGNGKCTKTDWEALS